MITYSELEIKHRSWVGENGNLIKYVDSILLNLEDSNQLLIAKYADNATHEVCALDFYRIMPKVSATDSKMYILLAHDFTPAKVVSVTASRLGRTGIATSINVVRESILDESHEIIRHSYWIDYDGKFMMSPVPVNNTIENIPIKVR